MQGSKQSEIPAARLRIIQLIAVQASRKQKRVGKIAVPAFVAHYYRGVAEEDLRACNVLDLAGAAIAHLKFGQIRKRGTPLVRVYSPDARRDGFRTTHTVVEVVADDMPFLVDSLNLVFAKQGLDVHLTVHPVLQLQRDRAGRIVALLDSSKSIPGAAESWQHIEIDRLPDEAACAQLQAQLLMVLGDVQRACSDWQKMRAQAHEIANELHARARKQSDATTEESATLIEWLADNHFTFLGYREFRLTRGVDTDLLEPIPATSLGILRTRHKPRAVELTGTLRTQARAAESIFVTKANTVSTVHRGTYLDYVGIKRFDAKGQVIGERRFLGFSLPVCIK